MRAHLLPVHTLSCLSLACLATVTSANDGGLTMGGTPRLLKGHPTVAMQSELILMTVGEETVTTDCSFVFRNDGPTCTVRMGFPDKAVGAEQDGQEEDPPAGTYSSFRSTVNGKPAKTKIVRARPDLVYHVKMVTFPAKSITRIRDTYTQNVGSQIIDRGTIHLASYILQSGSSWHGPIGRSEIRIAFRRRSMTSPLQPAPVKTVGSGVYKLAAWKRPGRLYYKGPCAPRVQGQTLTFVRTKWRPTPLSDIDLYFDAVTFKQ